MNLLIGHDKQTGATTYHLFSERATKRNRIPTYHQVAWDDARHSWVCSCGAGSKVHVHTQAASEMARQMAGGVA